MSICINCGREYEDPNDECLKPPEEGMTVADDGPWFHTPAVEEPDGADRTQEQTTTPRDSESVDVWDPLGGAKR